MTFREANKEAKHHFIIALLFGGMAFVYAIFQGSEVFSQGFFVLIFCCFSVSLLLLTLRALVIFLRPEKFCGKADNSIMALFFYFIFIIAEVSTMESSYSETIKSIKGDEKKRCQITLLMIFIVLFLSIISSFHHYFSPGPIKEDTVIHKFDDSQSNPETTSSPEPVASSQGSKSLKNDEMVQKDVAVISKDAEKLSSKKENAPPITPLPDTKINTTATVNGKKTLPFHENWLTLAADPSVITETNNDCGNKHDAPCLTNRLIELVELKSRENMLLSTDRKLSLVLSFRHSTQNPATGAGTFVELSIGVTETVDGVDRSCRFAISSRKGDPAFSTFYKLSGLREKLNIALELMADYLSERISGFVHGRGTLCGT